jgi:hypothetical protein
MSDPHAPTSDTAAFDDEPRTPMWLPAVGAALFLVVGIVLAVSALSHGAKADAAQAATVAPSAAAPSAAPPRPAAPPPPGTVPAGQAGGHEGLIRKTPAIRQ